VLDFDLKIKQEDKRKKGRREGKETGNVSTTTTSIIHYIFFAGLGRRARRKRAREGGQRRERKWGVGEIKRARETGNRARPSLSPIKVCSLEEVQWEEEKGMGLGKRESLKHREILRSGLQEQQQPPRGERVCLFKARLFPSLPSNRRGGETEKRGRVVWVGRSKRANEKHTNSLKTTDCFFR
jgi:hypothetical protein